MKRRQNLRSIYIFFRNVLHANFYQIMQKISDRSSTEWLVEVGFWYFVQPPLEQNNVELIYKDVLNEKK